MFIVSVLYGENGIHNTQGAVYLLTLDLETKSHNTKTWIIWVSIRTYVSFNILTVWYLLVDETGTRGGGGDSGDMLGGDVNIPETLNETAITKINTGAGGGQAKRPQRRGGKAVTERAQRVLFFLTTENPLRKFCIQIAEWK